MQSFDKCVGEWAKNTSSQILGSPLSTLWKKSLDFTTIYYIEREVHELISPSPMSYMQVHELLPQEIGNKFLNKDEGGRVIIVPRQDLGHICLLYDQQ